MEDFTTFTEVDLFDHLAVTANGIVVTALNRSEAAYVNKPAVLAGSFTFKQKVRISSATVQNSSLMMSFAVSDGIGNASQLLSAGNDQIGILLYFSGGQAQIYASEIHAGNWNNVGPINMNVDQDYYLLIICDKSAGNGSLTCRVYADSGCTALIGTAILNLSSSPTYHYLYAAQSYTDYYALGAMTCTISDLQQVIESAGIKIPPIMHQYRQRRAA